MQTEAYDSMYSCVLQERVLELPKEHEMDPKDKYTTFSRSAQGYRKSVHKVRLAPLGF